MSLNGDEFIGNEQPYGGGLYLFSNDTTGTDLTFDGNDALFFGGAIFAGELDSTDLAGTSTFSNSTFINNTGGYAGAARLATESTPSPSVPLKTMRLLCDQPMRCNPRQQW